MYEIRSHNITTVLGKNVTVLTRDNTNDKLVMESVMIHDEYHAGDIDYKKGDIFIDIGAHIGTWTILMASLSPDVFLFSVEPIPENYEMLKKNKEINNLKNIIPFNTALSGYADEEASVFYTDDKTEFGRAHKFVGSMLGGSGKELKVKTTTLNDMMNTVPGCRVLKTDCEGCEVLAFSTLSKANFKKIDYVVGEFHSFKGVDYNDFYSLFKPYFDDISDEMFDPQDSLYLRDFMFRRKGI